MEQRRPRRRRPAGRAGQPDQRLGHRETFEQRVLKNAESAKTSSSDCLSPNLDSTAAVLHCEIKTQKTVMDRVASIDGAVGYVSFSEAKKNQDKVQIITIDGATPTSRRSPTTVTRSGRWRSCSGSGPSSPPVCVTTSSTMC